MGSSYRDDLNRGRMPEWETKLRQAIALISEVRDDVWGTIGSDGQYDNAADDGALAETLSRAIGFIRAELPNPEAEAAHAEKKRLAESRQKAIEVIKTALRLDDSADYGSALWDTLGELDKEAAIVLAAELEE